MRSFLIGIILIVFASNFARAQDETNIQSYTPSVLFGKNEFEILSFYNLYTQTSSRNQDGIVIPSNVRSTFLNAMYQLTYGVSKSGRVNVGLDVNMSMALTDGRNTSPFNILFFEKGSFSRLAVTGIGPRIKVNPFASAPKFSVQSTFLIPVAKNLETSIDTNSESGGFVGHDRYTWNTQFFYDKSFGSKYQLFLELDFLYRIARYPEAQSTNFFRTPFSVFASYFPTSKYTVYGFFQYSPRFEKVERENFVSKFGLRQRFSQIGVGMKYQVKPKYGLEVSYGKFIDSRNDGNGYALNLGIRYIKR